MKFCRFAPEVVAFAQWNNDSTTVIMMRGQNERRVLSMWLKRLCEEPLLIPLNNLAHYVPPSKVSQYTTGHIGLENGSNIYISTVTYNSVRGKAVTRLYIPVEDYDKIAPVCHPCVQACRGVIIQYSG